MEVEIIGILIVLVTGWIAWLSINTIQNRIKITRLDSNHSEIQKDFTDALKAYEKSNDSLKERFDKMQDKVESDIKELGNRLDLFTNKEINILQNLIQNK